MRRQGRLQWKGSLYCRGQRTRGSDRGRTGMTRSGGTLRLDSRNKVKSEHKVSR